ncbi:hypothetical protein [Flavobacterium dankookense]|uniref:Uncharacterized protein n=1 Tax=Flavobacterium dankookense TaxID=706186 RepID=A0A4R6QG21_9FLAO|nr:hypothetical protein [Flavobacterium dankookense]TDP60903.1 hypothetical protein BC748_0505 [Flavobacterium dankookense]
MKFAAIIILFLFVTFLSTPTVVSLIEKNYDVSMFYSFAEEETHKELKEVKAEIKQSFDYPFSNATIKENSTIISENLSKHDNVSDEIFSQPPELI